MLHVLNHPACYGLCHGDVPEPAQRQQRLSCCRAVYRVDRSVTEFGHAAIGKEMALVIIPAALQTPLQFPVACTLHILMKAIEHITCMVVVHPAPAGSCGVLPCTVVFLSFHHVYDCLTSLFQQMWFPRQCIPLSQRAHCLHAGIVNALPVKRRIRKTFRSFASTVRCKSCRMKSHALRQRRPASL